MNRPNTTYEQRRVAGLLHWAGASWREPRLLSAIAGAALRDGVKAAGQQAVRAAALLLGPALLAPSASGQENLWSVEGVAPFEIATTRATVADRNGDGVREVVGNMPHDNADTGRIQVRCGRTGVVLLTILGEAAGDSFGYDIDGIGDVDGDAIEDLVVGAPDRDEGFPNAGKVYVCSGATGAVLVSFTGPAAGARLGEVVAGAGDLDADGTNDVVASAGTYNGDRGRVEALSVAQKKRIWTRDGATTSGELGRTGLSSGPDHDFDGIPDLLVSERGWDKSGNDDRGRALLCSGADGAVIHEWQGANPGDLFGSGVVWGGDVDLDGVRDVLINALRFDGAGNKTDCGRLSVFSGAGWQLIGTIEGPAAFDEFGNDLSCIGDLDGDGRDEIAAWAAYFDGDGGRRSGRALVYNGRTLRRMFELDGEQKDEYFGMGISRAQPLGDCDGDGIPDLATGDSLFDSSFAVDAGRLGVYSLAPLGLESSPPNPSAGDMLTFETLGGLKNALTLLAVVELNGAPTFVVADGIATLDGVGERTFADVVPPGLAGTVAVFRAYAIGAGRRIVKSPDETIEFR